MSGTPARTSAARPERVGSKHGRTPLGPLRVTSATRGSASASPAPPSAPRLVVNRSARHVFVQVVDDTVGRTLASASTLEADLRALDGDKTAKAKRVGELVAERAKAAGIDVRRVRPRRQQVRGTRGGCGRRRPGRRAEPVSDTTNTTPEPTERDGVPTTSRPRRASSPRRSPRPKPSRRSPSSRRRSRPPPAPTGQPRQPAEPGPWRPGRAVRAVATTATTAAAVRP